MRYLVGLFAVLILLAGVGAIVGAEQFGKEIRIDQATAQSAIAQKLPFEGKSVGIEYVVSDATVTFGDDGRFNLVTQVAVDVRGRSASAKVWMSSGLDYKRHSGSFYLEQVSVDDIEWLEVAPKEKDKTLFGKAVSGLKRLGVTEQSMGNLMASFEGPLKRSLRNMTEDTLASVRIYQLGDGIKGTLIARAVSEVAVEEGELVVSLSWADLFTRVALYIVIGFISLIIGGLLLRSAFRSGGKGGSGVLEVALEGAGALGGSIFD